MLLIVVLVSIVVLVPGQDHVALGVELSLVASCYTAGLALHAEDSAPP